MNTQWECSMCGEEFSALQVCPRCGHERCNRVDGPLMWGRNKVWNFDTLAKYCERLRDFPAFEDEPGLFHVYEWKIRDSKERIGSWLGVFTDEEMRPDDCCPHCGEAVDGTVPPRKLFPAELNTLYCHDEGDDVRSLCGMGRARYNGHEFRGTVRIKL